MLQSIRKAADNLIFRIILGLLVVAFGFWGVDDVLRSRNNFDIATFKNAKNVSEEEFIKAKAREIALIQRSQGVNLSEEQIKQSGIDEAVLDRIISGRLIDQLIDQYDLDFGDKVLADFIKQQESFKNKEGKFDINLFKAILQHSGMSEEEYTKETKTQLVRSAFLNSFMRASYVPDVSVHNITEFMSEERLCDVASIDLTDSKQVLPQEPSREQLEEFYKANAELFTLPEKRSVSYVVVNEGSALKDVKVDDLEVKQFFEENKEEFSNKPFAKVKGQIESKLKAGKLEQALVDFVKKLEDEVAAGTSLKEIAASFGLKVVSLSNLTPEGLVANKTIGGLVDGIFAMHAGEVSYPLELPDPKTLALVEVTSITEAQLQDLDKIKASVIQKWNLSEVMNKNTKIMQDFVATTKPETFRDDAKKMGLTLISDTKLKRSEISDNDKLPIEMLTAAFSGNVGLVSQVYVVGDRAFVALVKSAGHNPELRNKLLKDAGENIAAQIRNSLVQEIMIYVRNKEKVQINRRDRVLSE